MAMLLSMFKEGLVRSRENLTEGRYPRRPSSFAKLRAYE